MSGCHQSICWWLALSISGVLVWPATSRAQQPMAVDHNSPELLPADPESLDDAFCGNGQCDALENDNTCPEDCLCGNGVCNYRKGETSDNCPEDCFGTEPVDPFDNPDPCGDGECATDESYQSCPEDCSCGNGVCNVGRGETYDTCPQDCFCGDGICATGPPRWENTFTCPRDCHACGDGECTSPYEDYGNCRQDCPQCGDYFCDPPEEDQCMHDCACPISDPACNFSGYEHSIDYFSFQNNSSLDHTPYPTTEPGGDQTLAILTVNGKVPGVDNYAYVAPLTNCGNITLDIIGTPAFTNYFDNYRVYLSFAAAKNLIDDQDGRRDGVGTMNCGRFQFEEFKKLRQDLYPTKPSVNYGVALDANKNFIYEEVYRQPAGCTPGMAGCVIVKRPVPDSPINYYSSGRTFVIPEQYNDYPEMVNRAYLNYQDVSMVEYMARFIIRRVAVNNAPGADLDNFLYYDKVRSCYYRGYVYAPGSDMVSQQMSYITKIGDLLQRIKQLSPSTKIMLNGPYRPETNYLSLFGDHLTDRGDFDLSFYEEYIFQGGQLRDPAKILPQLERLVNAGIPVLFSHNVPFIPQPSELRKEPFDAWLYVQLLVGGDDQYRGAFFWTDDLALPQTPDFWFYYSIKLGNALYRLPIYDAATKTYTKTFESGVTIKMTYDPQQQPSRNGIVLIPNN